MKLLIRKLRRASSEIEALKPDSPHLEATKVILKELERVDLDLSGCPVFGPDYHDHVAGKWCIRTTSINDTSTTIVRDLHSGTHMCTYDSFQGQADTMHLMACNRFEHI